MCDCITNGSYGYSVSSSGGGSVVINNCQPAIPPMIYISNGNALNTFYGLSASNLYSVNSYTGNLYVSGFIFGNLVTPFSNSTISNATIFQGGSFYGNGYGISNLNASNLSGSANLQALTVDSLFFNNEILDTNLPISNTYQGIWGSFSNIPQISVDQYGRIGGVSNLRVVSSQWTTILGNVAYQNGVSIGTLSDPPMGSNLYVLGTANIDTLNVTTLFANSATVFGPQTLNVLGTSNLNVVSAQAYYGNSSGLSNLNASNLAFGVVSSALIYGNTLSNIQVSNVSGYVTGNVLSNLNASNLEFGLVNTALIYGNTLSNIQVSNITGIVSGNVLSNLNASNLAFGLINTSLIYGNTLSNIQVSNITGIVSGNVLSNLNASNLAFGVVSSALIYGNTVSNVQFSNVVGFFSNALGNLNASNLTYGLVNTALIYGNTLSNIQVSNITGIVSGNVLSNLNASNLAFGVVNSSLIYGNTLSNINGSNVSTVPTAQAVTVAAQPVITSVGTLTSLTVAGTTSSGTFSGSGSGLTGVPGASVTGTVQSATVAQVVSQAAQPNITSVGTLSSLTVTGTVSAGTFSGSGSSLTDVPASAISGTVLTAQSVVTAAQPNITSVGTLTGLSVQGLLLASNGAGISNINASNVSLGTLTTSVFPTSGATAGTYGSSANVSQVTVDQYGRVTSVSNVGFTALSQWTNINSNIAYGNGVSIGTLSNPPNGSNLYVLGTATITNVASNGSSISSLNSSNLVGNVASANVALVVSQGAQPNITSVGVLSNLVVANSLTTTNVFLSGNLNVQGVSNLTNVTTSNILGINGYYTGTLGIGASGAKLSVLGNVYASNAVQTPSVYATAATIGTVTTGTVNATTSFPLNIGVGPYTWTYGTDGTFNLPPSILGTGIIQTASSAINLIVGLQTWDFNSTGATTFPGTITADGGLLSNINSNVITQPFVNLVVSNSLTTTNVVATRSNITTLNVGSDFVTFLTAGNIYSANSLTTTNVVATLANVTTLNVGSEFVTLLNAGNVYSANSLTTTNVVSTLANITTLNVGSETVTLLVAGNVYSANALVTTNVVSSLANITTLNVGSEFVSFLVAGNVYSANSLTTTNVVTTLANITTLNVGSEFVTSLLVSTANVTTLNVASEFVTLLNAGNVYSANSLTTTNVSATLANVTTLNVVSESVTLLVAGNIYSANTLTTTNVVATLANIATLNVTSVENVTQLNAGNVTVANSVTVSNLSVSGNIIPVTQGNTYVQGNVVVAGNVYSSLGQLGAGGGYYLSLPTSIAVQPVYNGPVYGATYPLSIGLSNGFTINGTSTLITITSNGNFKFSRAGPYILNAVFNSSDNVTGLAVGSNVADIHGQDQGYLYRYTTFVSQNPTEVITIPINVTDTSLYYYLDLFKVDQGEIYSSSNTSGGTYLTITPLTGGGLATGGPGGTPGTQWISSGSNIYFPNSVGIGAVNPAYNLDVSTGTTATQLLVTSNISSLGLYGPILNVASNVLIQSNLAVGGGVATGPPYALYVTGQGYFSQHVSYDNFAGYRNRLINGTFRIAKRANIITVSNTSSFSLSNSWVMDRWHIDQGNLSTSNVALTIKQDAPVGPSNGFSNCANVYVTRAFGTNVDNTWLCPFVQTVESSGTYDLRFGQPTAKPVVLSFYANTTVVGTYSVVLRSKSDNTYFANLVSLTNSWNRYIVYVPACTIGTWGSGVAGSVEVCLFGVSFGATRANVAATTNWTASPGYAPVGVTGATNWLQTVGAYIQVTGVQIELGTIETPFEIRLLADTTRYCQRYFETNPDIQYASALGSGRISSVPFVITKRNNANVSVYRDLSNLTANTNISQFVAYYGDGVLKGTQAITSYLSSEYGFSFNFTNTGSKFMDASIMEAQFVWKADAEIY